MSQPTGPDTGVAPDASARLLAEAASRTGLVWVRPAGRQRAWPAWHVWHEGAVHVVSGPGEQELPALNGPVVLLLRSKDSGARLLTVPATARALSPDDEGWPAAARALAASRLNAAVPPLQLPDRWRDQAVITRIAASGPATERPGDYDQSSGAAAPAASPASTSGWRPLHLPGYLRGR